MKESSYAATPVPATTGETAAGRVRGRAPASHCAGVATRGDSSSHGSSGARQVPPGPPRGGSHGEDGEHDDPGDGHPAGRAPGQREEGVRRGCPDVAERVAEL